MMCGEEKEGEQRDDKSNTVGYQQRDREIDIGRHALGAKVIKCTGTNGEDNGEVEEKHGRDSSTLITPRHCERLKGAKQSPI